MADIPKEQEDKFTWDKDSLVIEEKGEGKTLQEMIDEYERDNPDTK